MDLFDILDLIGGTCLFLFGMYLMGDALEKQAGTRLGSTLYRFTSGRLRGFLSGAAVTAIVQSSSATTVMVVGFVNSGLMTLRQAISVIMGANVGTTVTAWFLSLTGIESSNPFVRLLKPSSFTPLLALAGVILLMSPRGSAKRRHTAVALLGFATLMTGMDIMSASMSGLQDAPGFRRLLLTFSRPLPGVLAGAVLTALLQSSSASVGLLQALSATGQVSYAMAIPIIMGQNIGTCVTALLSSVGTGRNARRAAIVHLAFNTIGAAALLALFLIVRAVFDLSAFTDAPANRLGIAAAHTAFNLLCTALLLPLAGQLESLAYRILPDR